MLQASDHAALLGGKGPFTVFAPTEAAFDTFSRAELERLQSGDKKRLRALLGYHFAPGKVLSVRFAGKRIRAVMHTGGDTIIDGRDGLHVNSAQLVEPDLVAANGIIHGIDAVLKPLEKAAKAAIK